MPLPLSLESQGLPPLYSAPPTQSQPAAPTQNNTVYWIGADGNVYYKSGETVQNVGKPVNYNENGFDAQKLSATSRLIDDPLAVKSQTNTQQNNQAPSGSGQSYTDTTAARALQQANIDAMRNSLQFQMNSINDKYNQTLGQYTAEDAQNQQAYNKQLSKNNQTRSSSRQAALVAGAQGARGLRATLASLGALNGTGELLANRTVAQATNKDIGEANSVFDNNAETLVDAWGKTKLAQENRKRELNDAKATQQISAKADNASKLQDMYKEMASFYTQAGNKAAASSWLAKAQQFLPDISNGAKTIASPFTKMDAVFDPGTLKSYLSGANDMTVKASGPAQSSPALNSPLYAIQKKREDL